MLSTAALTAATAIPPAPTLVAGEHSSTIKPVTQPRKRARQQQGVDDPNKVYDYINPCSLVSLPEMQQSVGEPLKFLDKNDHLTNDVTTATVMPPNQVYGVYFCPLDFRPNRVKLFGGVGVRGETLAAFKNRQLSGATESGRYFGVSTVPVKGLPDADAAFTRYGYQMGTGRKIWSYIAVHTKYGKTVIVAWSTFNLGELRELATSALRMLRGDQYGAGYGK